MSALLLLLSGSVALLAAGGAAGRNLARRRAGEVIVAARLETLRPSSADPDAKGILLGANDGPAFLRVKFARAGTQVSHRSAYVAASVLGALVLSLMLAGQPAAAAACPALALGAALGALQFVAARNTAALTRDLPFLLDAVRQHLTVGSSLQQALVRAVEAAGADLQRHFLPVVRRIENGSTVAESLAWLAERLDVAEVDMLSVTVQTNVRFGGAISPILSNLVQVLRDRSRVQRELKAATAETRLSGWILAGLPVLATIGVTFINPPYASFLFDTPLGRAMLAVAFGFQAVGCLVMTRIMRLDF